MTIERPMFPPVDPTRRRFLTVAAIASAVGAGTLAAAAMAPNVPAAVTMPSLAVPAVLSDPAFALIADKRAADIAHGEAIDAQDEADGRYGIHSDETSEADDRCLAACRAAHAIDWKLAATLPTTLDGVAAVLRFANEIEDGGMEWPSTDKVGPEGWHYQLRATMAAAVEALIKAPGSNQVRWKKMQLAAGHYEYTGLKPEQIEQAIDADEEWLKAHPVRKGGRKPMSQFLASNDAGICDMPEQEQ
jgi:hypothetical protein